MVGVDSTTCRAHQHSAGASTRAPKIPGRSRSPARHRPDEALGRSRGGLTSKIHLAEEGGCRPLGFVITPRQWGDAPQMIPVLEEIRVPRQAGGRPRTRPDHIGGDKAYSSRRNRRHLHRLQIKHTIPEPRDQRPSAGAAAAKEAGPQASTRRSTAAATRSSGPSTGSRTSEPSPRASTSGRTSSTGRSPWLLSGYGSVRSETPRSELIGTRVVVAQFAEYARVDSPDAPR
ncbi:transposase [Streptomyces coeruleoprunus]|uniref:Transposase n=1 Tax=Streptomyces coeruleoprunus TaxID=285563 RepID=A0ABV9XF86_9ACTN